MKERILKRFKSRKWVKAIFLVGIAGVLILTMTSCRWTIGIVRGSGDIETEEREVSGFDEVNFSGMGNLIIEQGDEESLEIEADDNIIPLIETRVKGRELYIGYKRGFSIAPTSNIRIHLTVMDLEQIELSGVGDMDCDNMETDKIRFDISGSGDIDFHMEAESIETNVAGLGNIKLSGRTSNHRVEINGSGKYDAEDLESERCEVEISGLGSATVNVSGELDVEINGAGNVYYKGTPDITQDISGLGRIKSLE
ncbi:MAG: DUF2807 domain-containing protein [Actinobacteria bacterium]|nr:DUF2807 domain-containing protein [Actinomycetota bacterium]